MKQLIYIFVFIKILQAAEYNSSIHNEERQVKSTQFLHALPPMNLSATVLANMTSKHLLLNISWVQNIGGRLASSFNIHVWSVNESDVYCSSEQYYAFIDDPNCNSWLVSPTPMSGALHDTKNFVLHPGCSYSVRVESNPHNGRTYAQMQVTVPDCVKDICNCRHAEFLPKPQVNVTRLSERTVNVTWFLPDLRKVSSFIVRVGKKLVDRGPSALYNLTWTQQVAVTSHRVYHTLYTAADTGGRFAVVVKALDFNKCGGPEGKRTFTLETKRYSAQGVISFNEVTLGIVVAIGCFVVFGVVTILYKHNCFSWLGIRASAKHFSDHALLYNAIKIKSERVFRRSNSLQERNVLYIEKEIEDAKAQGEVDGFEISFSRLVFKRQIGQGTFGKVFLASADTIRGVPGTRTVAVKVLKAKVGAAEREEFLEEIAMLKKVGHHPNIVSLLACCTLRSEICMVMEFVPCGDLLKYLRNVRQKLNERKPSITSSDGMYSSTCTETTSLNSHLYSAFSEEYCQADDCELNHKELQNFALQIAKGMAHLEAKRITHRDLAAHNILIDNNKVLKISDFGLSRRGVYVHTRQRKVPLRWLSIEAMRDSVYSSKSDVWAFAILLWEIGTLGGFPYPTVADTDLLQHLKKGRRLDQPEIVSKELFLVMLLCWSELPEDRPTFKELVSYLESSPECPLSVYVHTLSNPKLPPMSEYVPMKSLL